MALPSLPRCPWAGALPTAKGISAPAGKLHPQPSTGRELVLCLTREGSPGLLGPAGEGDFPSVSGCL